MKRNQLGYKMRAILLGAAVIGLISFRSRGNSIYWSINEVFSSADGSVQYVELATPMPNPGDTVTIGGYFLVNQSGRAFFFQMPYGSPSSTPFLLSTSAFVSQPGAVQPDVSWLPDGFLSPGSGSLSLEPYGASAFGGPLVTGFLSWSQLANGYNSFGPSGVNPGNSPENHAGEIGSLRVPDNSPTFALLCGSGLSLILFKKFRKPTKHSLRR